VGTVVERNYAIPALVRSKERSPLVPVTQAARSLNSLTFDISLSLLSRFPPASIIRLHYCSFLAMPDPHQSPVAAKDYPHLPLDQWISKYPKSNFDQVMRGVAYIASHVWTSETYKTETFGSLQLEMTRRGE
jgi:hypothetical protein